MKLKKVTSEGNYVVKMTQLEVNAINELLGFVNVWKTEYVNAQQAYLDLMGFCQEHSTLEFEDIFNVILRVDGDVSRAFILDEPVELHLKKDLIKA